LLLAPPLLTLVLLLWTCKGQAALQVALQAAAAQEQQQQAGQPVG
jgi:hypothetical protein